MNNNIYEREATELLRREPINSVLRRAEMVQEYAWAIPNDEALDALQSSKELVEIGAGAGYWASLLRDRNVLIHPYDKFPPATCWTEVLEGTHTAVRNHPGADLFLCWPPYEDSMAADSLAEWLEGIGTRLYYVGEDCYGCTANRDFFKLLDRYMVEVECITIPQWTGIHDFLRIFELSGVPS